MVRTMLAALAAGAALHPVATFGRHQAIELIAREAITLFIGVPFMFSALARTRVEPAADWSSLRLAVSASAAMPPELNREFHARFGLHVRQLYGSTETGSISVHLEPEIAGTLASVGRPLPGVEVRVLADDGTPVAAGETGEVAVRSPWAIAAYRPEGGEGREGPRAPEGTGSFRDGYFLTGDLGRLDPTGRLYLLGRKRFLINRGGYKVNPREIEEVLEAHPAVGDLVVVGEPTVFGDERIKAIVVPRGPCDAATLIAYCRGRIADFKIPSSIEFRDALPKSATGKVRRGLL
jgi:long-chain acyl-CoA synthetase